ncbi:MAG TPA: hypothetical protein VF838_09110 [Trebonia sp.]
MHFVGSIALDTPEEVFAAAGELLGPHLKRVPDGEPGGRRLWISFQVPVLRANPDLEVPGSDATLGLIPLKMRDGVRPEDLHFGELGYSREARTSYQDFLAARSAGVLPAGVRFQVSLPTPYAVINSFCVQPDAQQILPAYEQAMLGEVARITAAVPHEDLALQWDVCVEMLQWDGRWEGAPQFPGMEQAFAGMFRRLSEAVPADVELGFHLCYGDLDAAHFVEPVDATKMVELANLITANAGRPVAYVHMPVPVNRTDDAYYQPLSGLRLPAGTELYLGLVHVSDGVAGTRQRMAVAARYARDFGIASECGISRGRHPALATEFMRVYAGAAAAGPAAAVAG